MNEDAPQLEQAKLDWVEIEHRATIVLGPDSTLADLSEFVDALVFQKVPYDSSLHLHIVPIPQKVKITVTWKS